MKQLLILSLLLFRLTISVAFAQSDTLYMDYRYSITDSKSSAEYYITKPIENKSGWLTQMYYKGGRLMTEGLSTSKSLIKYDGTVKRYYANGAIQEKSEYSNGLAVQSTFYDDAGRKIGSGTYSGLNPNNGTFLLAREESNVVINVENGNLKKAIKHMKAPNKGAKEITTIIPHKSSQEQWYRVISYGKNGMLISNGTIHNQSPWEGTFSQMRHDPYSIYSKEYFHNGKLKSKKIYYSNGKLQEENLYSNNKQTLKVFYSAKGDVIDTLFYREGFPYVGLEREFFYKEPYPKTEYTLYKGEKHGVYRKYYNNGRLREKGQMSHGQIQNWVNYYSPNGKHFCKGYYKEGRPYEGGFVVDVQVDIEDETHAYIHRMEQYHEGKVTKDIEYFSNGNHFINDKTLNLETFLNAKGDTISSVSYKGYYNIENGVRFRCHPSGVVKEKVTYSNGNWVLEEKFNEQGLLIEVTERSEDSKPTKRLLYYTNGKLKDQVTYTDYSGGTRHTYYDKNGKELAQFYDKYGDEDGTEIFFNEDRIYKMAYHENGKLVRNKEFGLNGIILYDRTDNGKAYFYNYWGEIIGKGIYKDGKPYDGDFYTYKDGKIYGLAQYKEGERNGAFLEYAYKSIDLNLTPVSENHYNKGELHGVSKKYYEGALLQQVTYEHGLKAGKATFYDKNVGVLAEGFYKAGKEFNGSFCSYNNAGLLLSKQTYKEGVKTDDIKYDHKGQVINN